VFAGCELRIREHGPNNTGSVYGPLSAGSVGNHGHCAENFVKKQTAAAAEFGKSFLKIKRIGP